MNTTGTQKTYKYKYLTANPDIMGGVPVIVGTRVPIEVILHLLKQGYPLEIIHDDYPQIPLATLSGAVDEAIAVVTTSLHAQTVLHTQTAA